MAELKVVLHIFWALYRKKEYPRFVTFGELVGDGTLMPGLAQGGGDAQEALERGLGGAVARGLLLALEMEPGGRRERLYFLNTESDRRALDRVRSGAISLGALPVPEPYLGEALPNIFTLYEQNIGALTPMMADRLKEAEAAYPGSWVAEAIEEAVSHNRRSWSYIEAILRRWASEGKSSGEDRKHPGKDEDTEKYFRGRYGRLVKRRLP
ncbi:MAG: DnaD domain protein [Dehalococcoidia bacterium]